MTQHTGAGQMPENSHIPERHSLGRRVDRRQESHEPSPYAPRKVLPHGDVSPQGDRAWPAPSMTARVLTYGGAALAAAAVTAGTVLAVRKVADMVSGNDELDRDADRAARQARDRIYDAPRDRHSAPRFAGLPEREREAMRARARAKANADEETRARVRAEAEPDAGRDHPRRHEDGNHPRRPRPEPQQPQSRPPRARRPARSLIGEIEHSAESLSRNINGIVGAVGAAVAAFRSVAGQAQGAMREFQGTADQLRSFLGQAGSTATQTPPPRDPYRRPLRREVVDLRDAERTDDRAEDADARTHRL